jgi:hypothetical protein
VSEQKKRGPSQGASEQKKQTGLNQQKPDQVTLGDVTDPRPGHHQPPGREALPGQTSKTNQQKPGEGGTEDGVVPDDKLWEKGAPDGS